MVTNRGRSSDLSVADLEERTSWTLPVAADTIATGGVALNRGWHNEGLLALHASDMISLYRFNPHGPLTETARIDIEPPSRRGGSGLAPFPEGPQLAVAWDTSGGRLIAATSEGTAEFVVLRVSGAGRRLVAESYLTACDHGPNVPNDILTANGLVLPTATPTAVASPSPTRTPVAATPSATATSSPPGRTATPGRTPVPRRSYLPVALKEKCDPTRLKADVVLVVDASTSMALKTRDGRTKLSAAIEAVELFLGQLDFPQDQAAIVQFNGGVELLQTLTGDRGALLAALARIEVRGQTRIDLGIKAAHEELERGHRRQGNSPVMIVLTDGRANPVSPDVAVREADKAKADKVTIYTIGLGDEVNVDGLREIASSHAYYYRAPDAEDLAEIYSGIALEIPCPSGEYWGKR